MASVFGRHDALDSPAAMTARVLLDARRAFGETADSGLLERCAQQAVASLWRDTVKVKTFIPVLALREIRAMLGGEPGSPAG